MARLLTVSFLATAIVGLHIVSSNLGQAQGQPPGPGPDDGDAVLKLPGSDPFPPAGSAPRVPPSPITPHQPTLPRQAPGAPGAAVMGLWNNQPPVDTNKWAVDPSGHLVPKELLPREGPDPNQDLLVTPAQGPWMVTIICYTAPNAPVLAREMALELRNSYKLPAFVFNHGAEERRKEYQRYLEAREKKLKDYSKEPALRDQKVRIGYTKISEQCAVMVGGYASDTAAQRALAQLKNRECPDPNKVRLNIFSMLEMDVKTKQKVQTNLPVNPFKQAFVTPNPTVKVERPNSDQQDLATLRRLNADESYSLLQCKKPITLAVKQFRTDTVVQSNTSSGTLLEKLGMGGKSAERIDGAAHSAHNLAEFLRKANLQAYVLHTRYASVVTVGEFDNLEDPNIRAMNNLLVNRIMNQPQMAVVQFFPNPVPMNVPR